MTTRSQSAILERLDTHQRAEKELEECCLKLAEIVSDLRRRVNDLETVLMEQFETHSSVSSVPHYVPPRPH